MNFRVSLRASFALLKKELLALWVTPLAWALLTGFLLLQGISFFLVLDHYGKFGGSALEQGPVQGYYSSLFIPVALLLLCPALSMRSFAEERRAGTLETLLTVPLPTPALVLAKYSALLVTYTVMWIPTLLYVAILRDTGVVDWGTIGSSYLGLMLLGASYLAVGVLSSALTRSQLVAMLLCVTVLFGFFILGVGEQVFDPGPLLELCRHVSVLSHLDEFSKGIIDLRRIVFNLSVVVFALFCAVRVIDLERGEG